MRARDARSGSSRDFFLVRRERWTRWEEEEEEEEALAGLPRRTGEWELAECCWAGFDVVLPMLEKEQG